ncbi:MAG: type II toxin-antitoxin system VapC family toxin [Patescibacteria group bacterium]
MKYLLDTDVVIDHIRGRKLLNESVLRKGALISLITLGELYYGSFKSEKGKKGVSIIRQDLNLLRIEVLSLTEGMIEKFAKIKADLVLKGKRLEDFDLLIAASALNFNLTLVTRNIKHFERIQGLKVLKT